MKARPIAIFVDNSVSSFRHDRMELCYAARTMGLDVHVAAPAGPASEMLVKEGFTFHEIGMSRKGTSLLDEPATIMQLFFLYRRLKPVLVHHFRLKPVLHGSLAASLAGVPAAVNTLTGLGHVFTEPSPRNDLLRYMISNGCKRAFRHKNLRVVFQNPDDRAVFINDNIIPAEQTGVILGSGVDTNLFVATPEPVGIPVVVLASRMLWDKGIAQFVQAAETLKQEGVRARFVLVGASDVDNPTAIPVAQLEQWNRQGNVEWWGERKDMPKVLANSHIVCLPSFREGIPRILIEAAACGRPVVTTDAPGCREVVQPGDNGLLVPVQDAGELVAALRTLISNPYMRKSRGAVSRIIALKEFDIRSVVAKYTSIYKTLLGARLDAWAATPVAAPVSASAVVPRNAARTPQSLKPGRQTHPSARLEAQEMQSEIRP
jgi:glycosyltransferase involved in cell wall biosynthesis